MSRRAFVAEPESTETAKDGQRQRHRWVKVRPGNLSGNVDPHRDRQSPAQRDIGIAAMNQFSWILRWK